PGQAARALIELGEMERPERADARKDPAGAADLEIGTPDLRPATSYDHAALDRSGLSEALGPCLLTKHEFQPRRGHEKNFEVLFCAHADCIQARRAPIDILLAAHCLAAFADRGTNLASAGCLFDCRTFPCIECSCAGSP